MNQPLPPLIQAMLADPDCPDEVLRDALQDEGVTVSSSYLITGTTGSYSDTRIWNVAAFLDRSQAEGFLKEIEGWAIAHRVHRDLDDTPAFNYDTDDLVCPLDPGFHCEYNGVLYELAEIPLRG